MMCDYSLGGIRNRLAVEGEELVVHRFPTHSMGLAAPAELKPRIPAAGRNVWLRIKNFFVFECPNARAVCIPPGASLILRGIPTDLQRRWNIGPEEPVVFTQTSADVNTYRDAVAFPNGREVLLQNLTEGIEVKVVSLGGTPAFEEEPALGIPVLR